MPRLPSLWLRGPWQDTTHRLRANTRRERLTNRNLLTLLTLSIAILAVGCAEAPTSGIETVKGRLAAVETVAATYASDAYRLAEEVVSNLDAELETQTGAFALFRSYERAGELVSSAETAVDAVENAISAEKRRLRAGTDQLVTDIEQAVNTALGSIAAISSENLPEEQALAWGADLDGVEASLTETERLLAGDHLVEAYREADLALASAAEVNTVIMVFTAELERVREEDAARRSSGEITIPVAVLADGQELAAGTYRLRLAGDGPVQSGIAARGRWVEFVDEETVAGHGLAVVIPDGEIGEVSDIGLVRNEARVVVLKEGDYVRVWLNRDGVNYLVHLPPS